MSTEAARVRPVPPTAVDLKRLGARLRDARRRSGMTVAAAAAASGLSTGFISLLENGKTDATVGRMSQLLGIYDMTVTDAFGSDTPVVATEREVLTMTSEYVSPQEGLTYRFFDSSGSDQVPVHVFIEPGGGWRDVSLHQGEEIIFVLHGQVELHAGDQVVILSPGDRYLVPALIEHSYRALGEQRSELFVLLRDPEVIKQAVDSHNDRLALSDDVS